jgi:2-polyprenyl-3-methyl-5-hydroxy-6-metoxy-1,4-benzoquinol methylase
MNLNELQQAFAKYLDENDVRTSADRLDYSLNQFFRNYELSGKSVLEIGAGPGFSSVWCATHGASRVVAIEPEASGSTKGVKQEFKRLAEETHLGGRVEYMGVTLDKYLAKCSQHNYDYILMNDVVNHLDEDATRRLHLPEAEAERQRYRKIFRQLFDLLNRNGVMLISDVGRCNFWHKFKLHNPFAPTINFDLHQQPNVWNRLLCQCGFELVDIRWFAGYRFRYLQAILSYFIPAYFLASRFILRCRKP